MKSIAHQFAIPASRRLAATLLVAAFAIGSSLHAASASAAKEKAPASQTGGKGSAADAGEAHIKHLHDTLKITPAQEDQWNKVADVMRDNEKEMDALVKARAEKAKTMTAVEDLQSYAAIAEAHEDGTKKLIPVFKTLYDGMSDEQKKAADMEFREHGHHEHHGRAHPAA